MNKTKSRNISPLIQSMIIFTLRTASYIFILVNRQPIPLRPMALQVRYGFTLFVSIALILIFMRFFSKGLLGPVVELRGGPELICPWGLADFGQAETLNDKSLGDCCLPQMPVNITTMHLEY